MKRICKFLWLCVAVCMLMPSAFAQEAREFEPIRYGEPISYGNALTAAYTERSLTTLEDGNPVALVSVSGSNGSIIQVVDLNKEKIIHSFEVDYGGYFYYGIVTNDGVIYAILGKTIVRYDPAVKKPEKMGDAPTTRSGFCHGLAYDEETGILYGTTSNTGNVFSLNAETKEMKILFSVSPECYNVSRPALLGDYLYFGGTATGKEGTHVYRYNIKTGERAALPDPFDDDKIQSISYTYTGGRYVFSQLNGYNTPQMCYIWNTETEKWEDKTFNFKTSGMTDIFEGKYYYLYDDIIHSIDVDTLEIVDYPNCTYGSHLRGNGWFVKLDDPDFPGYSFVTAQYHGNLYVLNTQGTKMKRINVTLKGVPIIRRITKVGCDDKVYVFGFKGSNGIVLDPKTGEKTAVAAEQAEGMVSDPATGKIYHGDYAGGIIYECDPSKPYGISAGDKDSDTNPKIIARLKDMDGVQDRPFGMDVVGRNLVIGTLPCAGKVGGALTVINLDTYQTDIYTNIIPDQAILSVTHKDNIVYAATSVTGGQSSTPTQKIAHVFSYNVDTREIVKDVEIHIPGISGNLCAVHGLKIGPDGMLYGSVNGADFVMDPDTLKVVRQRLYASSFETSAGPNSQLWHENYMEFDERSGYLIRTGDIINPETLEVVAKAPVDGQFAGLDSEGNAYMVAVDTTVYKIPIIRGNDKSYLISNLTFFKEGEGKIYSNGRSFDFSTYEDNKRIMVPVRMMSNMMGGAVSYDDETKTVTIENKDGKTISFSTVDNNKISFGDTVKKFGVRMAVKDGVSYIPVQTLCDFLGKDIKTKDGISFIVDGGSDAEADAETLNYISSEVYKNEN